MKSRLEACAHAIGEDASLSPEQLFGALNAFLTQLIDGGERHRRRDEEERRTRHEQEVRAQLKDNRTK